MDNKILLKSLGNVNIYLKYEDMTVEAIGLYDTVLVSTVLEYPATLSDMNETVNNIKEMLNL